MTPERRAFIKATCKQAVALTLAYNALIGSSAVFMFVSGRIGDWFAPQRAGDPFRPWLFSICYGSVSITFLMLLTRDIFYESGDAIRLTKQPFRWAMLRVKIAADVLQSALLLALSAYFWQQEQVYVAAVFVLIFVMAWTVRGNLRHYYQLRGSETNPISPPRC